MVSPFLIPLEIAINRVLRFDPDTLARLGELDGKCIAVHLARAGSDAEFFLFPSAGGFRLRTTPDGVPDVTIRGDVPVFARLLFGGNGTSRAGELQISGDIELGQHFQRLLKQIDLDWEEQAARVVGDVAAHQLGRAVRGLRDWARQSRAYLEQDAREYLTEESRLLPRRDAVEQFLRGVDTLRADTDRLEKRLGQIAGRVAA